VSGCGFAETAIGYVHIDVCELRLAEGKLFIFLAIDRASKLTHVAFFEDHTKMNGAAFLHEVVAAFPYAIHTVLTDNGMAFAELPKYRDGPTARWMGHIFDRVCREYGIGHKRTKPYDPWPNGQGRADEPRGERGHAHSLPLPGSRRPQGARLRLRPGLQLRQAPQGATLANPVPSRP
jgi:transposase InsO family protein